MNEYHSVPEEPTTGIAPVNFKTLLEANPALAPSVIEGILREAAVGTVIGGSKTRKSWMMAMLVAATLTGGTWLGHSVTKGRLLLLDGELTQGTLFDRLRRVFATLGVPDDVTDGLDIQFLRGRTKDMTRAILNAREKGPGYYRLIIIDPLSCFYPNDPHFNENGNADMRKVYDSIITFASDTRAAVMVVHHFSKGSQADKSVVDLGSGAGAIARSGDAHIGLRAHKDPGAIVCDMVVREFAENAPTCWKWSFPVFVPAPALNPFELAGSRQKKEKSPTPLKPQQPTTSEFALRYITDIPREMAQIQELAHDDGISARASAQAVKVAVANHQAYRWDMGPKSPALYCSLPPELKASAPTAEVVCVRAHTPPHPPERAKARPGKGEKRAHTHSNEAIPNKDIPAPQSGDTSPAVAPVVRDDRATAPQLNFPKNDGAPYSVRTP